MVFIIKRRDALAFGASAMAMALARQAMGQDIPKADVAAPKLTPENGASLRILRPARFVEPTGSETQVLMRIGGQPVLGAFRERIAAQPGEILPVRPDPALVHLFDQQSGQRL